MDFAVFLGDEKTLIYKKGQGLVLNEPSMTAHVDGKIISVGKSAIKFVNDPSVSFYPIVSHGYIQSVENASVFLREMFKKVGKAPTCLICIPSSLDTMALNNYKTAFFTAGAIDVEFVPQVVTSAIAGGYDPMSVEAILSTVIEGDCADIAIIRSGEIIDGGTLNSLDKFTEAKSRLLREYPKVKIYDGGRLESATGAGKLLGNEMLIRKIVELN